MALKRSWIKRGTKGFSAPKTALKRTQLSKVGKSPVAVTKRHIQALLREIVILRDQGCILRNVRNCGGEAGYTFLDGGKIGKVVLQADHLITRSNSATYGDSRLVVCLCRPCHGGYKQWHKPEYDALVRTLISKERVALWDRCQNDSWRVSKMDWKLVELALEKELACLLQTKNK